MSQRLAGKPSILAVDRPERSRQGCSGGGSSPGIIIKECGASGDEQGTIEETKEIEIAEVRSHPG